MNRTLGLVFMIVGVAGIVISVLFVPAVWVGRNAAIGYAADVTDQVSSTLQQVQDASGQFRGDVETLRGPLEQVVGQTDTAAASGPLEQQAATRLLGIIDQSIGPAYTRVRDAYVNLREKVAAASQAAALVQRLVPGVTLPTLPTDQLTSVDSQLQDMDTAIRQARTDLVAGTLPDALPGIETLRRLGDGLRTVEGRLGTLSSTADDLAARAGQMQVSLKQAQASLETTLNIVAVVLTVLFADLAALNVGLFVFGREMRRRAPAPVAVAPPLPIEPQAAPVPEPSGA